MISSKTDAVSGLLCRLVLVALSWWAIMSTRVSGAEPKVELLWPQGAPGAKGDQPADKPTLTVFLPDERKAVGTAVVICPGGSYRQLCTDHEGCQIARWLNNLGVAGFMLEYRHRGRGYGHPAPLQDAQRAIRMIRARAAEWKIEPNRIGIMGFSAGGHLASTAGTHFDRGDAKAGDPIERVACRPDFLILCYPVIAFGETYTHRSSQDNLLGANADAALIHSMSNEKQVTPQTPPTFLFHTDQDDVSSENSVQFYLALHRAGVPAELHVYGTGPHGIGLGAYRTGPRGIELATNLQGTSTWPDRLRDWMQGRGLLNAK
jgi:acetyl esterase/lipase